MKNEQIDLVVLKKIQDVIQGLDELDTMFAENSQNQSKNDSEISDWLHVLQDDENLDDAAIASIGRKIAELRKERCSGKTKNIIDLPVEVDIKEVNASFKDNELTITLPKIRGKKVDVEIV